MNIESISRSFPKHSTSVSSIDMLQAFDSSKSCCLQAEQGDLDEHKVSSPSNNQLAKTVEELSTNEKPSSHVQLTYAIDDSPPWHMSLLLGFQHYLTMFGGTVGLPLLLARLMCVGNNGLVKGQLICTIFFASGIATLLQCSVGVRLPIVQGGTFTFLASTISILTLPKWKCPEQPKLPFVADQGNRSCWENVCTKNKTFELPSFLKGNTNSSKVLRQSNEDPDVWKPRMREIQGAIIVASVLQVIIGAMGVMGFLLRYIGPLTITPAISLVGLSLFDVGADHASTDWGIAVLTMALVILFSQYLKNVKLPLPTYTKEKGVHNTWFKLFELFPILFAVALSWILCIILTAAGDFKEGHPARTDKMSSILHESPWFYVPYPGQWGTPTVSAASVIGMVAGVMAGIIESIGDYYACARLAGAPSVPTHAVNRGILVEGVCCILTGAFGTGTGTTSFSENIGAIGITKVGSRCVIVYGALFMIIMAVLGKFGALFATIPEPIIGGVFIIMFAMVTAVGFSSLQFVDLNSTRNLFIVGFSIFIGLVVPKWFKLNPRAIDTGEPVLDQVLFVLLTTSMWVGGMIGSVLDNTLSGTDAERGILKWRETHDAEDETPVQIASVRTYDVPYLSRYLQRYPIIRYVPFLPYYGDKGDVEDPRNGNDTRLAEGRETAPDALSNGKIENDPEHFADSVTTTSF